VVTQPRRVAATSVAARVSAERLDDGSVGYAIRGESKQSKFTKLLFCTTGVVLRRMSMGDALSDITHVIVDEVGLRPYHIQGRTSYNRQVHERSVDGDFLLLELKELLATHKTLKVILMSATINHDTFVKASTALWFLSDDAEVH
jgi:ATP-dependent RNA helicase DHX57